jgi:hypothetical protein
MSSLQQIMMGYCNNGVIFLDKNFPNWHKKFTTAKLQSLEINNKEGCVLATVSELSFWNAVKQYNIPYSQIPMLGFATCTNEYNANEILTTLWQEIISKRLSLPKHVISKKIQPPVFV